MNAPNHSVFVADLPRLADSPQAASEGFRALLLQKDRARVEEMNRIFIEALREISLGEGEAAGIARRAMKRAALV